MRICSPLFASLVSVLLLAGCQKSDPPKTVENAIVVQVITVNTVSESAWTDTLGRVESGQGIAVRSQITGRLKTITFEPGKAVGQNTILYIIEDGTYRAKVLDAEAALSVAKSNRTKAERDVKRNELLWKQKVISKQTYNDSRTTLESAKLNELAAKAQWQQAVIDLNHCTVRAPVSGIPSLSQVNPGDMITAQSTLMTTMETPKDLRVVFTVADRTLLGKQISLESRVLLSQENGTNLQGKLDYISPEIGNTTATRTFRVKLSDKDLVHAMPGSFIRVRLETGRLDNVFRVPQKAVQQLSDGTYQVYLFKDGKAVAQPVTLAQWVDTDWVVTSGLKAGDQIITNQFLRLRSGVAVELVDKPGEKQG